MAARLLVVDDDRELRELLTDYLSRAGFDVLARADGGQLMRLLEQEAIDLLILDLQLPGQDGLDLCRQLRTTCDLPVLMLTARGTEIDRVVGLEVGADDYLVKPFSPRELLARIKALLRRSSAPMRGSRVTSAARQVRIGRWRFDTEARQLIDSDGVVVALSGAEYRLLKVFIERPNLVLSRDRLLDLTQGPDGNAFDRAIDVQVGRLRKRLRDSARAPSYIKTVRGEGYVFAPPSASRTS